MSGVAQDDVLFRHLVATNPRGARGWFGVRESIVGHSVLIGAAILIPMLLPVEFPETPNYVGILTFSPPAAAAAPLPKGTPTAKPKTTAEPVTPDAHPDTPALTEPQPTENPVEHEARAPESEQWGSATGSDAGIPEGMDGGQDGGQAGGVLDGVRGGCVGCTGENPVLDYDRAPRLIKSTRPEYPQDAFVKKIEGTVLLEILIDSTGRVVRARVLESVPALDQAAIAAVKQWVFEPAAKHGRPVATLARAPVGFRIF